MEDEEDNYPPAPRPRLRVVRFAGGGCSGPVLRDAVSVCFRFKEELDIDGVLVVGADEVPEPEPEPELCEVDA